VRLLVRDPSGKSAASDRRGIVVVVLLPRGIHHSAHEPAALLLSIMLGRSGFGARRAGAHDAGAADAQSHEPVV
jgi:hypothetical protein